MVHLSGCSAVSCHLTYYTNLGHPHFKRSSPNYLARRRLEDQPLSRRTKALAVALAAWTVNLLLHSHSKNGYFNEMSAIHWVVTISSVR
jgi:hypothetical protein